MFKFEPGSGIKVSQIVNLADDLSMALRAATDPIQAPVPGEAVVGIEVPNRKRERSSCARFSKPSSLRPQSRLMIALGKDIAGRPMAADLAAMPHLLIAGATGTGKSVSIHTMIASILFNATPDDVRFILIDPKMLELSVYDALPHLLVPVVVDPEKAAAALLWATREMEGRYRMMRDLGVRNIDSYNRTLGESGELIQLRTGEAAAVTTAAGDDEEVIRHRAAAQDCHRDRRIGRLAAKRRQDGRTRYHAAGTEGARVRNPSDSGDPAAVGGCADGPDQGQSARPYFTAGHLAGGLPHHP